MLTREIVRQNRLTWINFLKNKNLKKEKSILDNGRGGRCCLGHGCFALKIKRVPYSDGFAYGKTEEADVAPRELINAVGLYDKYGSTSTEGFTISGDRFNSLAEANDDDYLDIRPWEIAEYLESVIEGGPGTPFNKLTSYPTE